MIQNFMDPNPDPGGQLITDSQYPDTDPQH
jgi:hypothetical protein